MAYAEKRGKGEFPWRGRYLKPDGTYGSLPGFANKEDAKKAAQDQESDIRNGRWIDPAKGKMSLAEFRAEWLPAQDLAPETVIGYDYAWSAHIEPRWGRFSLVEIMGASLEMQAWLNGLTPQYSPGQMGKITSQLNGMFKSAVYLQYIGRSPMPQPGKRQSRSTRIQRASKPVRKGVVIVRDEVVPILERMPTWEDVMMVITGLFTGQRWSELSAMSRPYFKLAPANLETVELPHGHYVIDPLVGAAHRDRQGRRYAGPPKSGDMDRLERGYQRGRLLDFAPFLVELHIAYQAALPEQHTIIFPNTRNDYWGSGSWNELRWRPACDGREARYSPKGALTHEAWEPVHTGLVKHDWKHTHKAMLNDKRVHDVMIDYRLGHVDETTPGRYSHPTVQMRRECIEAMQETWNEWDIDLGYWGVKATAAGVDLSGLTVPLIVKQRRSPKPSPS